MQTRIIRWATFALSIATALVLGGCGGDDDNDNTPPPDTRVSAQAACSNLSGKTLGGAVISDASVVAATSTVPTYCKVSALIAPKLNLELRLPDSWNGKLHFGGGGGYDGSIPAVSAQVLTQGYATVSTDSGHQASGTDASWALNDPVAARLFAGESIPTVTSAAIAMLKQAYGTGPTKAYFEGCSNGGREALISAERYPNLFDGIIARAPAYNWVGFMGAFNRTARALAAPGGQLSSAKLATLAAGVRAACDASDGITDGIVQNPASCTFDPSTLRCPGGTDTADSCLSDAQLAVVTSWTTEASYAGGTYRNAGWYLSGNEDDPGAWAAWETGNGTLGNALQFLFQDTTVKTYLARDLTFDSLTYVPWDQNPGALYALASLNDATNTDLRPFLNRGGKLILWHGTNDAALSFKATTEYYNAMVASVGGKTVADTFTRYYIAPGVNHCAGGPGADTTDLLSSLDSWVTQSTAPGTLTATKTTNGTTAFTRPLCLYPQYPRYTGPANDSAAAKLASSYTCTAPST